MSSKIFHFPSFSVVEGDITVNISLNRFEKQYLEAQYWLDGQVFTDMEPFMPFRDDNLRNVSKIRSTALQGTGKVVAGAPPTGRFLYMGKVMIDPVTKSPWARPGAKKIVTDRPLNFDKTAHPNATDHWFEPAKEKHGKAWIKGVKRRAGRK